MDMHWSETEARNILLILATLIAAVTFQAGVNPPGGVWQDGVVKEAGANPPAGAEQIDAHRAGSAINAISKPLAYNIFLVCNTLAFSTSVLVIIIMTHKLPKPVERYLATIAMVLTYASAIVAVTPHPHGNVHYRYLFIAGFFPFLLWFLLWGCCKICNASKRD